MQEEFAPAIGADKQARRVAELFDYQLPSVGDTGVKRDFDDPEQVVQLLQELSPLLAKTINQHNYQTDRLDRAARAAAGLGELSRRRYNKRFRALRHLGRSFSGYWRLVDSANCR